jgi:hypothetical protein
MNGSTAIHNRATTIPEQGIFAAWVDGSKCGLAVAEQWIAATNTGKLWQDCRP